MLEQHLLIWRLLHFVILPSLKKYRENHTNFMIYKSSQRLLDFNVMPTPKAEALNANKNLVSYYKKFTFYQYRFSGGLITGLPGIRGFGKIILESSNPFGLSTFIDRLLPFRDFKCNRIGKFVLLVTRTSD